MFTVVFRKGFAEVIVVVIAVPVTKFVLQSFFVGVEWENNGRSRQRSENMMCGFPVWEIEAKYSLLFHGGNVFTEEMEKVESRLFIESSLLHKTIYGFIIHLNADLQASRNIRDKYLVGWSISPFDVPSSTGVVSHPSLTWLGRDKLAALAVSG
jgi:hypothetical protein